MRVLFVNENIGGHKSVHATLRRELVAHPDVEADFLDVPPPTTWRRVVGTSVPGLGRHDLDLQALRAQLALSSWVRRRLLERIADVDVIHVYTGNAGLRSVDLLRRKPSVVSTDATGETNAFRLPTRMPTRFTPRAVRAAYHFEKPVYDAATTVVANTRWVADSLRTTYGVGDDKLRTFPFGITAPAFGDGPAPGTRREDGLPRLVFVGRSLGRKGALRLHRLHQAHLADECELVIVSPEDVPPGRNVIAVQDVTVGSGRLWEELRSAAVFVFPSQMDQAPNAVIEAMAAGLPVVALDLDALPEMVPASVGTLVPRDDDQALVGVLRDLVRDESLRTRMGAAARARFCAEYDAGLSTQRLVDTLHETQESFGPRRRRVS